jgi:hypothetical protein
MPLDPFGPLAKLDPNQFANRIAYVEDFLPEKTFRVLQQAALRPVHPKRVNIPIHKRGATISYHDLHDSAPEIVAFYQSQELREWCSCLAACRLMPTPGHDLSSCSVLIYDRPHDHIRCHYDFNFYRGRHFTALLSLSNSNAEHTGVSSAQLFVRSRGGNGVIPTPPNTFVFFEGAYVYHGVTPLKKSECRIILSMTYCTDPSATALQTVRRRFKDIAYFGLKALWT